MKSNIWKSTFREIKQSFGRFFAILAIVALGVGFFAGLKVTRTAMVKTTQNYLEENQFYDYRLLSTMGFEQEDVDFFTGQPNVRDAEGAVSFDILCQNGEGNELVVKAHSLTRKVNGVKLVAGRLPEAGDECVVDSNLYDESKIGQKIRLSETNDEEDLEHFAYREYTIVGVVQSSYYIQFERGNTSLGTGRISGFIYLLPSGFDADYFTEVFVRFDEDMGLYSDEYDAYMDEKEAVWESLTKEAGENRYDRVLEDARQELADAKEELADKKAEAEEELEDARQELSDAADELADGEVKIADARKELADAEKTIRDKEKELADGKDTLAREEQKLADGEKELSDSISVWKDENYKVESAKGQLDESQKELDSQRAYLKQQQDVLESSRKELEQQEALLNEKEESLSAQEAQLLAQEEDLNRQLSGLKAKEDALNGQLKELLDQEEELGRKAADLDALEQQLIAQYGQVPEPYATQIAQGREEIQGYLAGIAAGKQEIEGGLAQIADGIEQIEDGLAKIAAGKPQLEAGRQQIEEGKKQLEEAKGRLKEGAAQVQAGKEAIDAYQAQIDDGRSQLADADVELGKAWKQIEDGQKELADGRKQIEDARVELTDGEKQLSDGRKELSDGKKELEEKEQELADGRKEYEDGLKEYEDANEDFKTQIADAEDKIADAQDEIDDVEKPDTYVLGRDTNVGYVCFESDSNIVDGIANIFPIFFFAVAALVCITTMNRMVEEQRTQIGVLKALGYGEGVIMGKYLFYSGSAAVLGCLIGYFGGTWLFPRVIWTAYGIMYRVDRLVYVFDWKLAVISLVVSLACSIGTTWLSCRYELSEVAAELMRPKSPKAGKRVALEYLPFIWKRLKFLYKVSYRNIFRYKKRFFMMVIGISGCTALLVTGFGIKDSIANVATQQFDEIQIYDIGVTLADPVTKETETALAGLMDGNASQYTFVLEKSVDLKAQGQTKSINLVAADGKKDITPFLNLHTDQDEPLPFPGKDECILTRKIAQDYDIHVGDQVVLQDENMREMSLTVSGISQNFIYNYVYVDISSYEEQMEEAPGYKTVYVNLAEGADGHRLSASLMKSDQVASVTVNEDTKERFSSMMASLDLIVLVVIICAAGLAFIVLYNLTNINITERIREIATIKVLGFYKKETGAYVFRENVVLTLIGTAVGLALGHFLHLFVMNEINIDMVAFDIQVRPLSYLYSVILTFAFAWFVNRIMGKKLDGISMTESLKSVD